MKKLFFYSIFFTLLTTKLFALDEYPLVKIISEPENNRIHMFSLGLDENGDMQSVIRTTTSDRQEIKLNELLAGDYVLLRQSDRDVIILQCPNCDPVYGGVLGIKYLRNGLSMRYRTLDLEIQRNDENWALFSGQTKVHTLRLKTRKVLGQVIGIRKIEINK